MRLIQTLVVLLLCQVLGACVSTGKLPTVPPEPDVVYRLGAGDALQITVFGEGDLTGPYTVSASGSVDMPLIGSVPAAGLTVRELQERLVHGLDTQAVKSPNVTISITAYRPFFVLGEVKTPGAYPYVPNMTVLAAVAIAGGFTYRASQDEISVVRVHDGRATEFRAFRDSRIVPGDVVNIFERHF